MAQNAEFRRRVDAAIAVDEIGIESGGYGLYRLKCSYEQIFERKRQSLRAVAVTGAAKPYVSGEEVPFDVFLSAVATEDIAFVDHVALALVLRNHANLEIDGLSVLVDLPQDDQATEGVGFVATEAMTAELDPALVICAIGEMATPPGGLESLAAEIRAEGMQVAIGDFGSGRWSDGQMDVLGPDIVRINGDWFQKICRDPMTVRLFDTVVGRLRERNARVLVGGIESEQHLGIALRAGVDLFMGGHLAPSALAGSTMVETLSLRDKLGSAEKIVPLYG